MSSGLLRGLAARALGRDAPLRSQRARQGDVPLADAAGVGASPSLGPLNPLDPLPQEFAQEIAQEPPAATQPPTELSQEVHSGRSVVATASRAAAAATSFVAKPRAEEPGPPRESRPAVVSTAVNDAQPAIPPRAPAGVADLALQARSHTDRSAADSTAAATQTTAPTVRADSAPAPLLPLTKSAPFAPAAGGSVSMRRGSPSSAAASESPTEVHISIGRVELTALAPTAAPRTAARRETPAGRSLADYLRGPGGKRPA